MNHRNILKSLVCAFALTLTLCSCGESSEAPNGKTDVSTADSASSNDSQSESSTEESAAESSGAESNAESSGAESKSESSADSKENSSADSKNSAKAEDSQAEKGNANNSENAGEHDQPAQQDSNDSDEFKIGKKMTFGVEPFTAKAGDKSVPVAVKVWNNKGFSATGMTVNYDPALKPVKTGEKSPNGIPIAKSNFGDVTSEDFMKSCMVNEEDNLLAFACICATADNVETDGSVIICYFDVPDDAKSGTKYKFVLNIDSVSKTDLSKVEAETAVGWMTIE